MIERLFRVAERGSTVRRELLGGATTFFTMAYIVVVNPAILAHAGLPVGPSTTATILVAAAGSLLMGLYANRPIAVAPYMGENAFIAFGLAALHVTWQERLGAVFVSGAVFLLITVLGLRAWLAAAISPSMKHGFGAAVGLFLAFIGLHETGIVVSGAPAVPVKLGDVTDPRVILAAAGVVAIAVLLQRRVPGAILLGMAAVAAAGALLGYGRAPDAVVAVPFTGEYALGPIAFELDIRGVLRASFLPVLLTLFVMSFLDTLGTLYGLGSGAGLLDARGELPEVEKPMLVDALACMLSGLAGTSTSGAYIESATGIREGARTGLAAATTAALFAATLFFVPLVEPLQSLKYAYGPALIAVGALMLGAIRGVDFDDLTEAIPVFLTVVMVVFTFNIANGLTAGLAIYPLVKALGGKVRAVKPGAVVLGLVSAAYYVFGLPH